MKKKILCAALILCMLICLVPTSVFAENTYTVSFDSNGGTEISDKTLGWNDKILEGVPDPTKVGYEFRGWSYGGTPVTADTAYSELAQDDTVANIVLTARWKDTEKPTGDITVGTTKWYGFSDELTFDWFFNGKQTVTINAYDNDGVLSIGYFVADSDLKQEDMASFVYRDYDGSFTLDGDGRYVVYVMICDMTLNITYLRSGGITIDSVAPVIDGVEDGKTYCGAQTVTVTEENLHGVFVDGEPVALEENNSFVLSPKDGKQTVSAYDRAGNITEITVTVNGGHTFGPWKANNDGTHTRKCTSDGCTATEAENCFGGTATCKDKAICEVCKGSYGDIDPKNHSGLEHIAAKSATKNADGNIEYWYCGGCDKYFGDAAATKEITKQDTVTKFIANAEKSPRTGESDTTVQTALLLAGSAAVIGAGSFFRKKKRISE